jgi:signal transduction histidine kinase
MLQVSRAVASDAELDELLNTIAQAATSVVSGANATAICLADTRSHGYRLAGSHGLTKEYEDTVRSSGILSGRNTVTYEAVQARDVIWVADAQNDPRTAWSPIVRKAGYRSQLVVPLLGPGTPLGVLVNYRWLPGEWSQPEVELLKYFAEHVSSVVRTAQLLAEREERLAGMDRLVQTLREQAHEHANRLHALTGLLEHGETCIAVQFLEQLVEHDRDAHDRVATRITHPVLSGFLLVESKLAAQRGIRLEVAYADAPSLATCISSATLVALVGNLIDNAADAVAELEESRRVVRFTLDETSDRISITVADRGEGPPGCVDQIFEPDVTSNAGHSGAGLPLVRRIVGSIGGDINVDLGMTGTAITVTLPTQATA